MATYQEACQILLDALNNLSSAYKAANKPGDKDSIYSVMEVLQNELNQIALQGLAQNDNQYTALTNEFKGYTNDLKTVENEVRNIVKYTKLAGDILSSLAKVATLL